MFLTSSRTPTIPPAVPAAAAPAVVIPPTIPVVPAAPLPDAPSGFSEFCGTALFRQLKATLFRAVISDPSAVDSTPLTVDRGPIRDQIAKAFAAGGTNLSDADREELLNATMDELFGFGPIQSLLDDPTVNEIMVNRADRVYVERHGKSHRTPILFDDDAHVRRIIDRIILPLGRRLDDDNPLVDARLPDGSRVNACVAPVAIDGPNITIRKFSKKRIGAQELINFGTMTPGLAEFLKACVVARINIVVSGGTGSGKTTLLNVLSSFIPEDDRIVTIEDAAELKLFQDQVIRLETKKANRDGRGEVSPRELVRNALRMRPERIIVGECRGGETLDMLQAMNTGHDGSLTTLHANTPRDAVSRMETMALMAGIDFPIRVVREQIAAAIELVVQQSRMRDGLRKITAVTEISGMEGDRVVMQELFRFQEEGLDEHGKVKGRMLPSGLRPSFESKLVMAGFSLPPSLFTDGRSTVPANGQRPTPAPGARW